MLQNTVYFLLTLGICVAALADCLQQVAQDRHGRRRALIRDRRLRLVRPWMAAWLVFQLISGILFLLSGELPRVLPHLLYFGAATLFLPFLLFAGAHWALAAGTPLFPFTGALRRFSSKGRNLRRIGLWRGASPRAFRALPEMFLLFAIPVLCTAVLFHVVPWRPAEELAGSLNAEKHGTTANLLLLAYLLISAAVLEEVFFRHYLLKRLLAWSAPGHRSWPSALFAVGISAFAWALGHGGMVEPAWLKWTQILLYGGALGITQIRFGLEAAIGIHVLFNIAAVVLGSWLAPVSP